jgi:hypothetical protein
MKKTENPQENRIFITYDYHLETGEPINFSLYKTRPKNRFFLDSKLVQSGLINESKLTLVIIKILDGSTIKYDFFGIYKNYETSRDIVVNYVKNMKSYSNCEVIDINWLELPVND